MLPMLSYKTRIKIRGLMPERALLRLRRAEIPLFNIQKIAKDEMTFCVWKKDEERVFSIYPQDKFRAGEYTPYTAISLGAVGFGRTFENAKKRVGIWIGCLLFVCVTAFANDFVFGVEFVGSKVYARETYQALEEYGIRIGKKYKGENVDLVCARLLSMDGVEFCSVKKKGMKLYVDVRTDAYQKKIFIQGQMTASHSGELVSLTVLRGTPLKKAGENIQAGESLVGDWFSVEEGGQVRVEIIARARIACTYEEKIAAADEESAFATAYLQAGLTGKEILSARSVTKQDDGYLVTLNYTVVESMNF